MSTQIEEFQNFIDTVLIRNKSILDQTTKLQDACTHLCRTISKAATTCGCITIEAHKQTYTLSENSSIEEIQKMMNTHVVGKLCPNCQELFEKELGRALFYLATIANTFELSLADILEKEKYRTELLGKYYLR